MVKTALKRPEFSKKRGRYTRILPLNAARFRFKTESRGGRSRPIYKRFLQCRDPLARNEIGRPGFNKIGRPGS
eukprot:COSAG06_NODE_169_length_21469_cov_23.096865_6_plen_73_part_00